MITEPDGTVEISVTSQTAGVSAVTATINSSSQSQNVTFIADVRTAKIADLVVIKDGSEADGSTANTLQVKVTDAFGNALAGQTVSVMAGNGATTLAGAGSQHFNIDDGQKGGGINSLASVGVKYSSKESSLNLDAYNWKEEGISDKGVMLNFKKTF
nr:Ig-like domain-containing protein [Escherichia coli]